MTTGWPNIEALLWAGGVSLIVGILTALFGKRFDARGQAEAALMNAGPSIIKEQSEQIRDLNNRIDQIRGEFDKLWRREHECREDLADAIRRLADVERRILPE